MNKFSYIHIIPGRIFLGYKLFSNDELFLSVFYLYVKSTDNYYAYFRFTLTTIIHKFF